MFLRSILLIFLFVLLRADTGLTPSLLVDAANRNPVGYSQLYLAAQQQHGTSLHQLSRLAVENKHQHWIQMSAEMGATESLFYLANHAEKQRTKKHYLSQAAKLGHAESQFQLAQLSDTPSTRIRLFENAASSGHKQAIVALYELFDEANTAEQDNPWFSKAAQITIPFMRRYADFLWQQQSPETSVKWLTQQAIAQDLNIQVNSKQLLTNIANSQWHKNINQPPKTSVIKQHCAINIQFIAGTLSALDNIEQLQNTYQADTRFSDFPMCFNQPIWLEPKALECTNATQTRLSCSLQRISLLAESIDFSHAIVVSEAGIANVHNGVMFLDLKDDYRVFVHELAHFAGLVDEYEMDDAIADNVCIPSQLPNVIITNAKPKIMDTVFAKYLDDYPELSLTKTATCTQAEITAYKPVEQTTFMEHHDIGVIPDIYLQIWRDALNDRLKLTPIYVNFAQWFEDNGDQKQASYWWQKYNNYRS